MIDRERLIAQLLQMLADLGWTPPATGDALDQLLRGGLLTGAQAEDVTGRDRDTIVRWHEAAIAEGRPLLGVLTPAGWLWDKVRLLDHIELKSGRYARNVSQTRAEKYAEMWSQPPQLVLKKRKSGA
ncbi:hypothetical protein BSZ19_04045 [Bradyrhizobium japonicum]|uniref:Uncharacterized protein n=1 Tax=Bradyrhizobium japonicum TaxID=375 RepID=A0A1Y2JWH6_BRAJP|nr:hypothetical protein [Bradyrhizobium japonicum]OSJ36480.1 hypothetical protein BSZ19_04045 [Bradyrhizobium japonicum]